MTTSLGISVAICCYNSASRLPETLRHLALQQVPESVSWEVIVINNASTDNTTDVALTEWNKYMVYNLGFKVIDEPLPGQSHARKKAIKAAAYDYVLFCDDDNHLNDGYIALAFSIMQSDETIGVLGGCGIFEPEQPAWAEAEQYKSAYVNGTQSHAETEHWVYGAGCTYRKKVLADLYSTGWEQITTGRSGSKLICGEDVEICLMYYLNGYQVKADDRLTFRHFVPQKRQNFQYILGLYYWQSYSYMLLSSYLLLVNNENLTIGQKLNNSFNYFFKALLVQLKKVTLQRFKITIEQKIALNSYYGAVVSLVQNRRKIIRQHKQLIVLLRQQVISSRFPV